jgi:hypothetical protein
VHTRANTDTVLYSSVRTVQLHASIHLLEEQYNIAEWRLQQQAEASVFYHATAGVRAHNTTAGELWLLLALVCTHSCLAVLTAATLQCYILLNANSAATVTLQLYAKHIRDIAATAAGVQHTHLPL